MKAFKRFIKFKSAEQKPKYYEVYVHKINEEFLLLEKHRMKYRIVTVFLTLMSIGLIVTSLQYDAEWIKRADNESEWSGLWDLCFLSRNFTLFQTHAAELVSGDDHENSNCHLRIEYIQKTLIVTLVASGLFGIIGTTLSMGGFITGNLFKKYYYFHSGAEFFLVSGLAVVAVLVIYPIAIRFYMKLSSPYILGYGYGVCWLSGLSFLISSFIMLIDEILPPKYELENSQIQDQLRQKSASKQHHSTSISGASCSTNANTIITPPDINCYGSNNDKGDQHKLYAYPTGSNIGTNNADHTGFRQEVGNYVEVNQNYHDYDNGNRYPMDYNEALNPQYDTRDFTYKNQWV